MLEACSGKKKGEANGSKALGKGRVKKMSKMGVSKVASYTGAQISRRSAWGRR